MKTIKNDKKYRKYAVVYKFAVIEYTLTVNCQVCGKPDASVSVKRMSGAMMEEYYLCDSCAQAKGVLERGSSLSIGSLLKGMIETGGLPGDAERLCPSCGRSLERIKREGRLGCVGCAESFAEEISAILKRLGAKPTHTGRIGQQRNKIQAQALRKRLVKALEAENYEEAARLRDALKEGTS